MRKKFLNDIQAIYDELSYRQEELNGYFALTKESHEKAGKLVDDFLNFVGFPRDSDSTMATLTRVVNLKEDALEQVLTKAGLSTQEIREKKELAYDFVNTFYTKYHQSLLNWIEDNSLLTPFYRTLLQGAHHIGIALSKTQKEWSEQILYVINASLEERFKGDDEAILDFLEMENLFEKDNSGIKTPRSYSVLQKNESGYRVSAYSEVFKDSVRVVGEEFATLIKNLEVLEDSVYGQKIEWIAYFESLREAFLESDTTMLLEKWQTVDVAWMRLKTPLQVGHPLEYYEDHYRKAVALEWDVRIVNPALQNSSLTRENIIGFALKLASEIGENAIRIATDNIAQVQKTQLYIGVPMLYYAAEYNGLFSAQVVPNDKSVSDKYGHKIFAYSDFVLASKVAKPIMQLGVEMFGVEFIKKQREFAKNSTRLWHEVYDISTIGHEFGHILWLEYDSESKMNKTGQLKNIEEFKATAGGLMAFFHNERESLKEHIVDDLITRSVGLMAWREVGEVLPYYCEGLIHLDILFGSKVITYKDTIVIDYSRYEDMKNAYKECYKKLAMCYINKEDANGFLKEYAIKENGYFLPKDKKIRAFVEHYYDRYKAIGQQVYQC